MTQRPFNPMPDGTCRTIKANYARMSRANFLRGGVRSNGSARAGLWAKYGSRSRTERCMTPTAWLPASVWDIMPEWNQR